ncbi:MAG: hypothetical protein NZM26_04890 [Patescibacteria group bacterium]|nr:hypothetical protein [Patescibacteria group bacterium]
MGAVPIVATFKYTRGELAEEEDKIVGVILLRKHGNLLLVFRPTENNTAGSYWAIDISYDNRERDYNRLQPASANQLRREREAFARGIETRVDCHLVPQLRFNRKPEQIIQQDIDAIVASLLAGLGQQFRTEFGNEISEENIHQFENYYLEALSILEAKRERSAKNYAAGAKSFLNAYRRIFGE